MDTQTALTMVHPDDIAVLQAATARSEAVGMAEAEYRQRTKAGDWVWVSTRMATVNDKCGQPWYRTSSIRDITEHKRAEAALQASEKKYRMLFDSIYEGYFLIDVIFDENDRPVDLFFVEANAAATWMIGRDWTGKRLTGLSPGYEPSWFKTFGEVAKTGKSARLERYAASDNRWYDVYAFKIGGPESRRIGNTFVDVTERKQAEEALRESNRRINDILDSIQDDFYVLGRDWKFVYASRKFTSRIGKEPEDCIGNTIWEMFPKHLGTVYEENLRAAMEKREIREFELHGQYTDVWYRMKVFPSAEGITLLGADITERKLAEEAMAAAHRQFQSIIDNTPAIVYAFDLEERFVMANTTLAELCNTTPEQMNGKRRHEFMPTKEDADWHEANDHKVIEAGQALEFEEYSQLKDRSITWLTTKFPLRDAKGRIYAVAGISADLTERKRAEETLKEYAANLRRSNEDLELFAYVSSHDLQEPLRNLIIYTQLLARKYKGQIDADTDVYISYIVTGGQRMQKLINDLLEFSRVTSKGKTFALTNVESVVKQVENTVFQFHGIDTAVISRDPLPTIIADENQLVLVFQNLIANAIKFRSEDPVQIHIGAERIDHGWKFSVKDNGIGIEPQYYEKIFVIFQRLHGMDQYEGTGIGLAIVKRIIERHGGRIWVESEPRKGSTFCFTIPDMPANVPGMILRDNAMSE